MTTDDAPQPGPAFGRDTVADKVARFGCGAILGVFVLMGVLLAGFFEPFGMTGVVIGAVVLVVGAGIACVTHGDPAIQILWKLIKWLA